MMSMVRLCVVHTLSIGKHVCAALFSNYFYVFSRMSVSGWAILRVLFSFGTVLSFLLCFSLELLIVTQIVRYCCDRTADPRCLDCSLSAALYHVQFIVHHCIERRS